MCGITGYTGARPAVETVLSSLKRLEYRGYDSSGVAFANCGRIRTARAEGRIGNLERELLAGSHEASAAIAHTRWATHGRPTKGNAHPHLDCTGRFAIVHNGIIENYAELRAELIGRGHCFRSETDTEVIAHLVEEAVEETDAQDPDAAAKVARGFRAAMSHARGSYAVALLARAAPDTLFVVRKDSPLVIGLGAGENFVASDIPAVMGYTRSVILLEDGDFAMIDANHVRITDSVGSPVSRAPLEVTWDDASAEKGGYAHFMLKEIHEGARTVRETMRGRLAADGSVVLPGLNFTQADWRKFRRITIVGCGTAYHAGVVGKRLFEQLLRRPVEVSVASEFRYGDPLVDAETLVVLISQSGETADTLAAMREARARGAATLAIVNVIGSSLARDADSALLTQAGPEIGVASTKAYLAQLTALSLLALYLWQNGAVAPQELRAAETAHRIAHDLPLLPELIERCLAAEPQMRELACQLAHAQSFFFLGRGYDYALALEAALKLKEISYLHAEAYAAGEMKHGPLALVESGVVVVGFCTQPETNEKMISNLREVKARDGLVVAVVRESDSAPDCADAVVTIPEVSPELAPIVAMVSMQLLAYHIANEKGCSIDQPRNLAKSVTVE